MGIQVLLDSNDDKVEVPEKSTLGIVVDFEDEEGQAVAPTGATWTLTDLSGAAIPSCSQVTISALATSVTIVLQGEQLQILTAEARRKAVQRRFLVEAIYNSNLGTGLPLRESCEFSIRNLKFVS